MTQVPVEEDSPFTTSFPGENFRRLRGLKFDGRRGRFRWGHGRSSGTHREVASGSVCLRCDTPHWKPAAGVQASRGD